MKHIIGGLVATLLGIWGIIVWWYEFGAVMRGMMPLVLLGIGVIAITAGLQTQQQEVAEEKAAEKKAGEKPVEEAPEVE